MVKKEEEKRKMDALSEWVASIRKDIPLHITRFFPRRNMTDKEPTNIPLLYELQETAKKHLDYVLVGNV